MPKQYKFYYQISRKKTLDSRKLTRSTSSSGNVSRLDKDIEELEKLLLEKPDVTRAVRRLLAILDRYLPDESGLGAYTECQRLLLTKFPENTWLDEVLDPLKASEYYKEWQAIVDLKCAIPPVAIVQLFDGTDFTIRGVHTHCDLRQSLFEKKNVISRGCNDCFKVQVLPADLKALMQVHFIFRRLELPRDNFRKCMIELREDVSNPYKAYIFCESEGETNICLGIFERILRTAEISNVHCGISHGCSEFGLKYPEFKYSKDGAHRSFERPVFWDQVESEFWSETPIPASPRTGRKKLGISIRDILGYRTWIDYAEGIGDDSWRLFRDSPSTNKPRAFVERVQKQSELRNAQMKELQQRLLSTV